MACEEDRGFAVFEMTWIGQFGSVVSWFVVGAIRPALIPANEPIHSTSPDALIESPIAPLYETTGTFPSISAIPFAWPASQAIVPFADAFTWSISSGRSPDRSSKIDKALCVPLCVPLHRLCVPLTNVLAQAVTVAKIGALRAAACERRSRITHEAASPETEPSRAISNGLHALDGVAYALE